MAQLHEKIPSDISFAQLVQAVVLLTGLGCIAPVQDAEKAAMATDTTRKLNLYLLDRARSNAEVPYLVSPLLGGWFAIGRLQQLFAAAYIDGKQTAKKMATQAWACLEQQGQNLLKDGKPLSTAKETLTEMQRHAEEFIANDLPILKALGIV